MPNRTHHENLDVIDLDAFEGRAPNLPATQPSRPTKTPRAKRPSFQGMCLSCTGTQPVTSYDSSPIDVWNRHRWQRIDRDGVWLSTVQRKCRAHGEVALFVFNDRQSHMDWLMESALIWNAAWDREYTALQVGIVGELARIEGAGAVVMRCEETDPMNMGVSMWRWAKSEQIQLHIDGELPDAELLKLLRYATSVLDKGPTHAKWWPCTYDPEGEHANMYLFWRADLTKKPTR